MFVVLTPLAYALLAGRPDLPTGEFVVPLVHDQPSGYTNVAITSPKGTHWFCLDTGAPRSIVAPWYRELLGLKSQGGIEITLGPYPKLPGDEVILPTLRCGRLVFSGLPAEAFRIHDVFDEHHRDRYGLLGGKRLAGLIGRNFLERYGAVIDYRTMTMRLRPAQSKLARMQGAWTADARLRDGRLVPGGITIAVRGANCTLDYPAGGWTLKARLSESAQTLYGESALDLAARFITPRGGESRPARPDLFAPFLAVAPGERLALCFLHDPGLSFDPTAKLGASLGRGSVLFRPSAGLLARLLPVAALLKPYAPYADDPVRFGRCTVQYCFDGTLTVDADRPAMRATFRGNGVTLGPLKP